LDTHSARAYGLLAYCTSIDVRRWLTCEPGFRRALTLDPRDPQVRMWYGSYLGKRGRSDEAIASVQAALREDPTSLSLNQQLAWEFYRARRMDESVRQAEDLITLQPRDPMSYIAAARAYEWKGEFEKALAAVVEIERYGDPLASECLRASIEGRRGNAELARGIALKLRPEWEKGVVESVLLAEIYCQTHDNERAVETLNAGFDRSDPSVLKAAHHPSFEVLKSDRGFQKFLSRIGLPAG
jgi:tetratricopeptide (TPR) repeat protein